MHNTLSLKVDKLQQQKSTSSATLSDKNKKLRLQYTEDYKSWTIKN